MPQLQLRRRIYSWVERSVLATGALGAGASVLPADLGRLVFVCSGNICRSPYAEFVARARGLEAISAGTHTRNGLPADRTATAEASLRGVDMGAHQTTRWEDVALRPGDLIVAMQLRHALAVRERARHHDCHVVMLNAFLLPRFAVIWDPYGKVQPVYAQSFDLIESGVERLAARLQAARRTGPNTA
jgi:protein-tyrosine phosphatase